MRTRSSRPARPSASASRTRPSRHPVSYRELSSDNSDQTSSHSSDKLSRKALERKRRRFSTTSPSSISAPDSSAGFQSRKPTVPSSKKLKVARTESKRILNRATEPQLSGAIPPWESLPYEILFQIFQYASYPLIGDRFEATTNVGWLLRAANVCKSFAEPVLSALYYAPPLSPPSRAQGLIAHLASQDAFSTFNYRSKVKFLDVEGVSTLLRKFGRRDPINLADLVIHTPQLRGIGIHLETDDVRFQRKYHFLHCAKWLPFYSLSLLFAMEESQIHLHRWKWNLGLSPAGDDFWSTLSAFHHSRAFQSLRELEIVRLDESESPKVIKFFEEMSWLPNLKNLSFSLSPGLSTKTLRLLPSNLESLQVIACPSLTSILLHDLLRTHGVHLRKLVVDHNQALSLSFLTDLATACPKLEVLSADLVYYNTFSTFSDSEPRYEALLLPHEVPDWPQSLQVIELHHLRKWHSDTAEKFFQSLLDSAALLPNLRRLVLKASIEIGWRDRATFRDKWIGRLRKVFLKASNPPGLRLSSLKALEEHNAQLASDGLAPNAKTTSDDSSNGVKSRRSKRQSHMQFSHVEILSRHVHYDSDSDDNGLIVSVNGHAQVRRSTRLKQQENDDFIPQNSTLLRRSPSPRHTRRQRPTFELSSEGSMSYEELVGQDFSKQEKDKQNKLYIQGLCDVVDVRIDNLRPTEEQFTMDDFLDEEPSGDEDWNGEDVEPGEGRYAW